MPASATAPPAPPCLPRRSPSPTPTTHPSPFFLSSVVRSFRLTATETAAALGTALVRAALALADARERADQQREAAEAPGGAGPAAAAAFARQADDLHRQAGEARASLRALYQGVAAARFRDVLPDVRAVVIEAVGDWIRLDPAANLSDAMLKAWVGWVGWVKGCLGEQTPPPVGVVWPRPPALGGAR